MADDTSDTSLTIKDMFEFTVNFSASFVTSFDSSLEFL